MAQTFNEERFKQIIAEIKEKTEKIEIDIDQLTSAKYDSNPYGLEPHLAWGSGEWDYDEEEEWSLQCAKMIGYIQEDGLYEYVNIDEKESKIYQPKVIEWLEKQITYY